MLILCFSSFHFLNSGSQQIKYAALLGRTSNPPLFRTARKPLFGSTPIGCLSALLTRHSRSFPEIVGEVIPPQKYFNFRKTKSWEELLNYYYLSLLFCPTSRFPSLLYCHWPSNLSLKEES